MNFRKLLYPFSILYDGVTALRNHAYDIGWKESRSYDLPIICVGNLSVGGTGKSPMIEYLLQFLKEKYNVAVLSRGYKRKTSGYVEVRTHSTADEVGDEPLQFKKKFPEVTVAVCADRRQGIEELKKKAGVILLDDAFQHRRVKPSFTIVLTPFDDLYLNDHLLPAGNLRESRSGIKRADMVIVTKCPPDVPYASLQEIQYRMELSTEQSLFFSRIGYGNFIKGKTEELPVEYLMDKPFSLVTGIANPKPLVQHLKKRQYSFEHLKFPDHHDFTPSEINTLKKKEIILTTEKDYMRLQPKLDKFALYYLPITTEILNSQSFALNEQVLDAIEGFGKS
ncbi:tetraacyldisaccharide 4'-kinase [Aureisphaera galaxeae]|uniref:tetraacyldisaccharide 4'-kinase n=1 Tax=Aureisphaera galaxeae TaxID=1538023 RepID=UPI0023501C6A|nr:tetraacyldisaccharide 4'-kinase [Aureisphaera galaxeae]MDC8006099.1 tetraacyldisaccharide 4'-kinase [Aureisphaera galaxeae]